MSLLIRNARVLTLDAADSEHARADILIEGSRIVAIGPDLQAPASKDLRIVEAAGSCRIEAHGQEPDVRPIAIR